MIVYRTTNLINGKFYIGKQEGINELYLGSGTALKAAIKKYGRINFKKEELEKCNTREELCEREKYWINHYKAREVGYNIAEGGAGGNTGKRSEETKLKISKILTGKKKTQQHKDNLSKGHKGNIPWNKGKGGYAKCKPSSISRNPTTEQAAYNISEAKSVYKNIECRTKEGDFVKVYRNMREVVAEGFDRNSVGKCIKGIFKQHKGFFWRIKQKD